MSHRTRLSLASRFLSAAGCLSLIAGLLATSARADEKSKAKSSTSDRSTEQVVGKAIEFLRQRGQAEDGSFSKQAGPAVTALVTTAVLRHGRSADDPLAANALKYLQGFVREDGGIYAEGSKVQNYETSLALMCFVAANRDGRYDKLIKNAEKFLKDLQWDGQEGHDESSFNYGGAGYGGHKRPDLSNTSF